MSFLLSTFLFLKNFYHVHEGGVDRGGNSKPHPLASIYNMSYLALALYTFDGAVNTAKTAADAAFSYKINQEISAYLGGTALILNM